MQQGAVAAGRCVANRQQDVGVRKLVRVIVRQRAACVGVGRIDGDYDSLVACAARVYQWVGMVLGM